VTAGTTLLPGSTTYNAGDSNYCVTDSWVIGRFQLAASHALEVQHYGQRTQAGNGFGPSNNQGVNEIFTQAEFWQRSET
jgi:hypothetical protein